MNLFELQEEKEDIECNIRYYEREKERLEIKTGIKATDYTKEIIQGSSGNSREDALLELAQMEMHLDDAIKKLENINNLENDKYNNFKKYNDYDKQIYTEKKLFKWSNAKISAKHNGLGKSQIYRILEKFDIREKRGKKSL